MKAALALLTILLAQSVSATHSASWQPVQILGYEADQAGITFRVPSGGCTYKEDLKLLMQQPAPGSPVQILLVSRAQDSCKAFFPYGVKMHFNYDEIGLPTDIDFRVLNEAGVVHAE